ncbi:unnamed protein product [Ixodes pacificus]
MNGFMGDPFAGEDPFKLTPSRAVRSTIPLPGTLSRAPSAPNQRKETTSLPVLKGPHLLLLSRIHLIHLALASPRRRRPTSRPTRTPSARTPLRQRVRRRPAPRALRRRCPRRRARTRPRARPRPSTWPGAEAPPPLRDPRGPPRPRPFPTTPSLAPATEAPRNRSPISRTSATAEVLRACVYGVVDDGVWDWWFSCLEGFGVETASGPEVASFCFCRPVHSWSSLLTAHEQLGPLHDLANMPAALSNKHVLIVKLVS